MKIKSIEIKNYKILKDFEIDFLDKDGNILDLIVLAGVNGSGKTTLLEIIYQYGDSKKREFNKKFKIEFDKNNIANEKIFYQKAEEFNIIDLKQEIVKYIKSKIFKEEIPPKEAYKEFNKFLNNVFDSIEFSLDFKGLDENENIYFLNRFNEEVAIDNLSTGEKELLKKVFYFFVANIKDSIILIDEPEISLHPSWQEDIVKIYKNLAKSYNNQIILATHSPHIIASTPNDSLFIFAKENDKIVAKKIDSFGKDINLVLLEVMGSGIRDKEVEEKILRLKKLIAKKEINSEFKELFDYLEKNLNDEVELGFLRARAKALNVKS
ncbi:AAA family ATPase [Hydrogenimonas thermophila]|uniref:AAA domain-containing protein, putative AbiEii toxin, Type IV TA system n=1 Tax=Hydrogenimonas thermophila TaxID=223786 RepID=A0A1I5QFH1_9BACT|nr:AAA family ATPase [Hydrogenimonas thermophila]WOE68866.1 AAA family ATPase [Hydrogenimonas thermophila]WOE71374.1 AAA family ATPase [Hydrogenimonas thermophila]SFP45025.1 AAA domain-containing protein, putative AbiEii toxin, Type IV TA system [Hydrogenimonas thermophila]